MSELPRIYFRCGNGVSSCQDPGEQVLFEELAYLAEKHGFKVVLCPLSHMKDLRSTDRNSMERNYLSSEAARLGFVNAYAHRLLAEGIYREFQGLQIVN